MRRVLLLVNPRHLRHRSHNRQLARIRQILAADGRARVETAETTPIGAGASLTPQVMAEAAPDAVFVCGGDGTLLDAMQTLANTEVALGILPFGTGNVLATNLGLPRDPVAAAARLASSVARAVPVGRVTLEQSFYGQREWYFAFAAGVGTHAALMQAASAAGKGWAGRGAYWATGIRLLLTRPAASFALEHIHPDGTSATDIVTEALAVRVGRLNVWRPGGSLLKASLRLATVPSTGRLGLAKAVALALAARSTPQLEPPCARVQQRGTRVRYQDVVRFGCRIFPGDHSGAAPLVQADGEVLGRLPATIAISDSYINLLGGESLKG